MSTIVLFLKMLYQYRAVIATMALQEIKNKYIGTMGGVVWSIINPLLTIFVYWLVFSIGLKVRPIEDAPFIVYFCAGLIPWMTFTDTLIANTNVLKQKSYLIKKMVFPTEILPIVTLLSNLIAHGIMLIIFLIILLFSGLSFSLINIQVLYYIIALCILSLGLSWLLSAINVFFRDTSMILGVVINLWFWLTPIVWIIDILPVRYQPVIKLNPMYYIVDGYRNAFIYHIPFWKNYKSGIYFWLICLSLFACGGLVFKKLKSEFGDAL
ncbi:ABC transporter permease [Candidatus Magnetominusculus dajiuhuensis]|uniref:ABC transporter permease n=1 Tax=Candidatus Magnetominusculus dajiuhuensis TaxID=3137712 RepID=UPI003B437005